MSKDAMIQPFPRSMSDEEIRKACAHQWPGWSVVRQAEPNPAIQGDERYPQQMVTVWLERAS